MDTEERIAVALEKIADRLAYLCKHIDKNNLIPQSAQPAKTNIREQIQQKLSDARREAEQRMITVGHRPKEMKDDERSR